MILVLMFEDYSLKNFLSYSPLQCKYRVISLWQEWRCGDHSDKISVLIGVSICYVLYKKSCKYNQKQ